MPDLFDSIEPPFDHQATWQAAEAAKVAALEQVEANAGEQFMESACDFVLRFLAENGPSPGEDMTDACRSAGIVPVNGDRAFGAVYSRLSRRGLIVKDGYCDRRKGHGTAGGIVWRHA